MSALFTSRTYWCDSCHVPLLGQTCLACGADGRDIASANFVPVFRPEIHYLKKQTAPELHSSLRELETWVMHTNHTYYSQGVPFLKLFVSKANGNTLTTNREIRLPRRTQKEMLDRLRKANCGYIEQLQYEAENFIRETTKKLRGKAILVSFSGGKDSTVVSHLVMSALGRSDILHIFADTTIELPDTYKYLQEFQLKHPFTPFITSHSSLDFFKTAETIGPPSRILRWCCTTHKTNPLSKLINGMSPAYGVLTFYGIRRMESVRRAQYPRISDKHKIAREILARPILNWTDLHVWIYLLYHGLTFNQAYKKGFRRVGCLYCPFNSAWSQRMIQYRYPKQNQHWQSFLLQQANRMQHPNPESFASHGWRVRAGGRGLDHYKTSIEAAPCILSDHAVSYQLLSGDIRMVCQFLRPFGPQTQISSNDYSETFLIHDHDSNEILASVEVGFEDKAIRINYLIKKYKRLFQQRVEKQLRKLQSCIFCGACGAKCPLNALEINGTLLVNNKCVSCLACVKHRCPAVKSLHYNGSKNGRI